MVEYLRITDSTTLPDISYLGTFKCVVVVEGSVTPDCQAAISKWLVDSGCLYMMAWGSECSTWDDTVDEANLEDFNYEEIPDSKFVMTTWHDDEPLQDVLWFAKYAALHSRVQLENTLILHVGETDKRNRYMDMWMNA